MTDLPKAIFAATIQEDLKKVTKNLQKHDSEIPERKNLGSKESFNDLKDALGKPVSNKPLTFEEELARKVKSRQVIDSSEPKTKNTEEKIDNHAKRLEELNQKQQDLENRKKELETKKANPNISREERWKITAEIEGINNQFKNIDKETKTIGGASSREKQFNRNGEVNKAKTEPTAADLQQQGAMAAIKRMKETKKENVVAKQAVNNVINSPNGKIPIPPPFPGAVPPPPPMPGAKNLPEVQQKLEVITKQINNKDSEADKHKNELAEALKKRAGKQNPGRGM